MASPARDGSHPKATTLRLAVLSTVIQGSGYKYDIAVRFQGRFGDALPVRITDIYPVIRALERDGLIELLPLPDAERERRRPRQHYGVTSWGREVHRRWLAESLLDDPTRTALLVTILAASVSDPTLALDLVHHYERTAASEMSRIPRYPDLPSQLIADERRMVLEARLRWAAHARARLTQAIGR